MRQCLSVGGLAGLVVFGQLAWGQGPDSGNEPSISPMRASIERYRVDREALERRYGSSSSRVRNERLQSFFRDELVALQDIDANSLDPTGRVDFVLLRSHLEGEQRTLAQEIERTREVRELVPFAEKIVDLEEARRRMEPQQARDAAAAVATISRETQQLRRQLEEKLKKKEAPSPVHARRAVRLTEELRADLRQWQQFYSGYHPEFGWWLKQPYEQADKELADYIKFARQRLMGQEDGQDEPVLGDAIGREALLDALATEFIPYTPEELIRIAEREFAWCEREMRRAANDLGCGDDWKKALDKVSQVHVPPGDQPQLIKQLADEATKFLEDRQLVTIPALCKETWRMTMMSPERQKVTPYFTGGEVISVSYPTEGMTHDDKLMSLRGNNIHFCRATVHHEVIPGHHLQSFMADRYATHREVFRTPFLVEGWALYWEMLLWDLNFQRSAEDRVGMLFWRAHRCARIIFSLKLHLGEMKPDEAIKFLIDRVGHEPRNATAEVRRSVAGDYGPLYQAAYMLGGLQLMALRRELVDSGRMTDRQFHDAVLRENAIPIELIRASLTGQKLPRDYRTKWRFYSLD